MRGACFRVWEGSKACCWNSTTWRRWKLNYGNGPSSWRAFFIRGIIMSDMFIRLLIGVLLAAALELLNGFLTFLLPPLIVITPACLVVALVWAVASRRSSKTWERT